MVLELEEESLVSSVKLIVHKDYPRSFRIESTFIQ